jgi:hypothetical protein
MASTKKATSLVETISDEAIACLRAMVTDASVPHRERLGAARTLLSVAGDLVGGKDPLPEVNAPEELTSFTDEQLATFLASTESDN